MTSELFWGPGGAGGAGSAPWGRRPPQLSILEMGVWPPGAAPDPRDHGPGVREHPRGPGTPRSRHHNPLITGRELGRERGGDLPRFTGHTGRAGLDPPLQNPFGQSLGSKGALDTGWGVPAVGGMVAPEDMSHRTLEPMTVTLFGKRAFEDVIRLQVSG